MSTDRFREQLAILGAFID